MSSYCGVGAASAYGRDVLESTVRACQFAGISVAECTGGEVPEQVRRERKQVWKNAAAF